MRLLVLSVLLRGPGDGVGGAAGEESDPKKQAAEQAARGDAWAVANRCDEAVKAYRQALTLQPKNPMVQVRLAHCLAKTGGAAEAKQMLGGARRRERRRRGCSRCRSSAISRCSRATLPAPSTPTTSCSPRRRRTSTRAWRCSTR